MEGLYKKMTRLRAGESEDMRLALGPREGWRNVLIYCLNICRLLPSIYFFPRKKERQSGLLSGKTVPEGGGMHRFFCGGAGGWGWRGAEAHFPVTTETVTKQGYLIYSIFLSEMVSCILYDPRSTQTDPPIFLCFVGSSAEMSSSLF